MLLSLVTTGRPLGCCWGWNGRSRGGMAAGAAAASSGVVAGPSRLWLYRRRCCSSERRRGGGGGAAGAAGCGWDGRIPGGRSRVESSRVESVSVEAVRGRETRRPAARSVAAPVAANTQPSRCRLGTVRTKSAGRRRVGAGCHGIGQRYAYGPGHRAMGKKQTETATRSQWVTFVWAWNRVGGRQCTAWWRACVRPAAAALLAGA